MNKIYTTFGCKVIEMLPFLRKISPEQYTFILIALIGVVLFSYNLHNAPLTADELSAIYRSRFNSIAEVFKYSIQDDVHPPLIQLFLFYWLKVVSNSEVLIKLPFLLMGISSILLIYKLSKKWFNQNTALLSTAFFVSIQFVIMYNQIARPYISGLFLCLLFAIQWSKIIEEKAKSLNYVLYFLFGMLLSYNHYFGTLQVAVIGFTGLFFIKKNQLTKYLIINALIGLSFIPSISIMIKQMNYDGIDYLVKPTGSYFVEYVFYIFQYSWIALISVGLILLYTFIKSKNLSITKYHLITYSWFILPFIIGYVYSVFARPVMPFRSLLFSLPFLIIFLFSFSQKLTFKITAFACFIILGINIYTLTAQRNHYSIFEKGIAKSAVLKSERIIKEGSKPLIIYNTADFNIQYYQKIYDVDFEYTNLHNNIPSPIDFRKYLINNPNNQLITFNLPHDLMSIAKEHYPSIKEADFGFGHNYSFLSTNGVKPASIIDTTLSFENLNDQEYKTNLKLDSITHNHFYQFNDDEEWGPILSIDIPQSTIDYYCLLESSIAVKKTSPNNGLLVFEILNGDESIAWRSSNTSDWITPDDTWQNIYFSVQLNDLLKNQQLNKSLTFKVYFWNQDKKSISIDNLNLRFSPGNRLIYSLLEDFPKSTSE